MKNLYLRDTLDNLIDEYVTCDFDDLYLQSLEVSILNLLDCLRIKITNNHYHEKALKKYIEDTKNKLTPPSEEKVSKILQLKNSSEDYRDTFIDPNPLTTAQANILLSRIYGEKE